MTEAFDQDGKILGLSLATTSGVSDQHSKGTADIERAFLLQAERTPRALLFYNERLAAR